MLVLIGYITLSEDIKKMYAYSFSSTGCPESHSLLRPSTNSCAHSHICCVIWIFQVSNSALILFWFWSHSLQHYVSVWVSNIWWICKNKSNLMLKILFNECRNYVILCNFNFAIFFNITSFIAHLMHVGAQCTVEVDPIAMPYYRNTFFAWPCRAHVRLFSDTLTR